MYENAFIYYNSIAAHRIPELRAVRCNISVVLKEMKLHQQEVVEADHVVQLTKTSHT